jgi:putative peptidoglycan lipid II flippase
MEMANMAMRWWGRWKPVLFGATGAVTLWNGGVALLAFVKDVLTATLLGTSVQADALTLAYFLPDMIGSNLLAAAVGVACVPVFSRMVAQEERERLRQNVNASALLFTALSVLIAVCLSVWSRELVHGMSGDAGSELGRKTLFLFRFLVLIIVPFPVLSIGTSLLQAARRFTVPAAVPVVPHIAIIGAIGAAFAWRLGSDWAAALIAAGAVAGVAAMALLTWSAVARFGLLRRSQVEEAQPRSGLAKGLYDQREIWRLFGPYLLILLSGQSVYFVERLLAAHFEAGTIAGLNYAFRLAQFPIWVFVAAVYSVALPSLSEDAALGESARLRRTLARAFKDTLIVTVPTTFFFFLLREPLVAALFQRGAFDAASVRVTAALLAGYALTIVGQALSAVCLRYFLAAGSIGRPLAICLISSALNIAADIVLAGRIGAAGVGYGAAIGASANALLMLSLLASQLKLTVRTAWRPLRAIGAANALPLLVTFALSQLCERTRFFYEASGIMRLMVIAGFVFVVAAVYVVCLNKWHLLHHVQSSDRQG